MARYHARQAQVSDTVRFLKRDVRAMASDFSYGHLITNPPYGQRMSHEDTRLFCALGEGHRSLMGWSCHVICAYPQFERAFGAKADARRVVYNGQIPCRYFQFYGPRPPKGWSLRGGRDNP